MARRGMRRGMRSFIIHMSGDAKRAPNAQKLLDLLPNAEIVDAIIGKAVMASGQITPQPGNIHSPRYPFPLGAGEVGCFLSHRACWQRIVDLDLDYALITEDDLSLDLDLWSEALDLIATHANADSFIRLPAKRREASAHTVDRGPHAELFLPRVIGLQTVCQVVGKTAARRLLDATEVLDRPVDTFLQMHWITQQQIHTILPNGVSEITDQVGGSTIQKKNRSGSKVAREFKRAMYRAKVSSQPQRA